MTGNDVLYIYFYLKNFKQLFKNAKENQRISVCKPFHGLTVLWTTSKVKIMLFYCGVTFNLGFGIKV